MTTAQQLDDRYGRVRKSRIPWIIGAAVAAVAVGAFFWLVVANQLSVVDADDLGFELVDEHSVTVHFQVTGVQDKAVVCIVEALDREFGVVGWKVVDVAATDAHSQALSTSVPTVGRATTGLVNACWVA